MLMLWYASDTLQTVQTIFLLSDNRKYCHTVEPVWSLGTFNRTRIRCEHNSSPLAVITNY